MRIRGLLNIIYWIENAYKYTSGYYGFAALQARSTGH